MDGVLALVAILGGISGVVGAYAAIVNMKSGKSHAVIERAQFLEDEVTKLSEENESLLKENIDLSRENTRLRNIIARRQGFK